MIFRSANVEDKMESDTNWTQEAISPGPEEVEEEFWSGEEIAAVVVLCVLIPFIIGGNLLVIFAVFKYRRLKSTTNYFLVSLAVADICTGLFAPVHIVGEVFKEEITHPVLCLGPHCLLMTVCGASILCLAAIAYDRYTALTRTLEYIHIMTVHKMVAFTVFAWVYSAAVAWLPLMNLHYDIEPPNSTCTFHLIWKEPLIVLMTGLFLPAYLVIFFCYARIFCIARRHVSAIAAVQTSLHRQIEMNFMAKDTKYAKTLGIVMGFFVVLWLPYQICILVELVSDVMVEDWVRNYLALLSYCNSGINPWIYTFRNQEFKKAFMDILSKWCSCCKFIAKEGHRDSHRNLNALAKRNNYADDRRGSFAPSAVWSAEGSDDSRRGSGQRQLSIVTMTTTTSALDISMDRQRAASVDVVSGVHDEQSQQTHSNGTVSQTHRPSITVRSPSIIINVCEEDTVDQVPVSAVGPNNSMSPTPEPEFPQPVSKDYLPVPKITYGLFTVMNSYS